MDKGEKHHVKFFESIKDSAKALEPAKEAFDFIAATVHGAVVLPGGNTVLLGWYNRNVAQVEGQLASLAPFVGPVHEQVDRPRGRSQSLQKLAPFWRVVGLAGRQRKRYGRSSIRGNQMNLGVPSPTGFANRLGAVFFNAPVPSGCTLTEVLSSETASILIRTI